MEGVVQQVSGVGDRDGGDVHQRELAKFVLAHTPAAVTLVDDGQLQMEQIRQLREDFTRFRMYYQFGIDEVLTKITILQHEFEQTHPYSPIEHVRSRLKSVDSLLDKVQRRQCERSIPVIRDRIRDIAGIRIVCSFVSDVYWIAAMLQRQADLTVVTVKDYIANPKPNGYQSLHMIVQVPVFLSDRTEDVYVELQIRTIAMDFWASVEHKLSYKYRQALPSGIVAELEEAARIASDLDRTMARLREEIHSYEDHGGESVIPPEQAGQVDLGGIQPPVV